MKFKGFDYGLVFLGVSILKVKCEEFFVVGDVDICIGSWGRIMSYGEEVEDK